MTSALIAAVRDRLLVAGYSDLPTPLHVAPVAPAHDAGSFGDVKGARVRQRIEALSRALDVTGSRLVLTAILAGATLAGGVEALAETCRVLQVEPQPAPDGPGGAATAIEQMEDRIRVLLPLSLPEPAGGEEEGGTAVEQLRKALPSGVDTAIVDALLAASRRGEVAVTKEIGSLIDAELKTNMDPPAAGAAGEGRTA